jgi:hypothetical protein
MTPKDKASEIKRLPVLHGLAESTFKSPSDYFQRYNYSEPGQLSFALRVPNNVLIGSELREQTKLTQDLNLEMMKDQNLMIDRFPL